MRISKIQYNYINRYNNYPKPDNSPAQHTEAPAQVNFQGLLYFLTKDKRFDVINEKNAKKLVEKGLENCPIYNNENLQDAMAKILYIAKTYDDKYYRAVLQKIFALGKDGVSIDDLLEFKGITRSFSHFEKQTDRISQANKLGYPIVFMPKLFERDIHNPNDIKKLVDIREEGLIRKDKLSYSFWQAEADDVDYLLLSEPKYTLNTLKILGKKSFLASFEEKYDFVENLIDNLGRIDEEFPLYDELLRLTNPTESKLYLENREKITTLKKLYQKNQEDNELKNKINNLTKSNRNLVENAIKNPKDKILAGQAAILMKDEPKKLRYLLPTLNDNSKTGIRKRNKMLNNCFLTNSYGQIENRIDFRKTKFIPELICSDSDFYNNFKALIDNLAKHPNKTVEEVINKYVFNKETQKQFSKININYNNWTKFNPQSNIKKVITIDTSTQKQHAIKNLEADFNDELFSKIPPEEFSKLEKAMSKKGYHLIEQSSTAYTDDGFFDSVQSNFKIFKNNSPIKFDDLPELMKILKKEMTNSEFWNKPNDDPAIENARNTLKAHLLRLRNSEIRGTNVPDTKETVNLEVLKADMNNIEHSLFLGNYASCCTAVGSGCNQWAAPAYTFCKLASAIEVKVNNEYVGNTMCYIGNIDGKPALILDNIELQHKYQYNDEIRDTIFAYARKLAGELNQPDMPVYAFPNRHKVNMDGLEVVQKDFNIVGSTGDCEIYLDFDADAHKISGNKEFNSYLYRIS